MPALGWEQGLFATRSDYRPSVQEMVEDSAGVIIGVSCDRQLGPAPLSGSGGVMVEVYNDVALRRCPITRLEARAMIAKDRYSIDYRDG